LFLTKKKKKSQEKDALNKRERDDSKQSRFEGEGGREESKFKIKLISKMNVVRIQKKQKVFF